MSVKKIIIDTVHDDIDLSVFQKDSLRFHISLNDSLLPILAEHVGVEKIVHFSAQLELTKLTGFGASAFQAEMKLKAQVTQICGVSLEAFDQEVTDSAVAIFVLNEDHQSAQGRASSTAARCNTHDENGIDGSFDPDAPVYVPDGKLPIYTHVAEWLSLSVDPYPVKPGADWQKVRKMTQPDPPQEVDPRFMALQDFMVNKNGQ